MGDQGSSYAVLQDIPVMVSPQYRLPKQIVIENELLVIPDEALALAPYSFSVERQAISNVVSLREKQAVEQKSLTERLEAYQAEKLRQKRAAARKIAPGFLDTETRILHPQPFHHQSKTLVTSGNNSDESDSEAGDATKRTEDVKNDRPSSTHSSPHLQKEQPQLQRLSPYQRYRSSSNPPDFGSPTSVHQQPQQHQHQQQHQQQQHQEKRASAQSHFDYLKFEQGLAPPDPWDTPENDMMALRSILGSQETKEQVYPSASATMPAHSNSMPTPQYASSPYQQHYHPMNNKNIYPPDGPWVRPPPSQPSPSVHTPPPPPPPSLPPSSSSSTPFFAPAIPPKLFKEDPNEAVNRAAQSPPPPPPLPPQPVSSSSSPAIPHSQPPPLPPQVQQQETGTPPPLPPFPSTNDALVQELANMGFSHAQATDALQKNENNLIRATNFLLDNT